MYGGEILRNTVVCIKSILNCCWVEWTLVDLRRHGVLAILKLTGVTCVHLHTKTARCRGELH